MGQHRPPVPGFVPGQPAAPFLGAPVPGVGPAPVTDVTGRLVSPEGRTIIADNRTPAERAARRAEAVQNANTMISERRDAEKQSWEDRRSAAKQRARQEWESEEQQRLTELEHEAASRLMDEMQDLQAKADRVRRDLA